jgi:2-oxoglutarate ferredoxin oxidoreductase subunit alpha
LLAIDWKHAERLLGNIALDAESIVVTDPEEAAVPEAITASAAQVRKLPLAELASEVDGGRANMVALGYLAAVAGIPRNAVIEAIEKKLGGLRATMQRCSVMRRPVRRTLSCRKRQTTIPTVDGC